MKKTILSLFIAVAALSASAQIATTNDAAPPPTSPQGIFDSTLSYFTSVNTNLTWANTPFDLWTGANYANQVNTSAEIGASYDIWHPSAAWAVAPELIARNAGVAGTLVSAQGGVGLSLLHFDVKITGYLDVGDSRVLNSAFIEAGLRAKKKITQHSYTGIGIGAQHYFAGKDPNSPTVTGYVGGSF